MKKETTKSNARKRIDWAAEVRKHKRQLNALQDAERQELIEEGFALINGPVKSQRHVGGG